MCQAIDFDGIHSRSAASLEDVFFVQLNKCETRTVLRRTWINVNRFSWHRTDRSIQTPAGRKAFVDKKEDISSFIGCLWVFIKKKVDARASAFEFINVQRRKSDQKTRFELWQSRRDT